MPETPTSELGEPSPADLAQRRFHAQLLCGPPARSPIDVVQRILAVQAQDSRGMRLAIRSRSTGFGVGAVDAALDARAMVVSWLNRGTMHLVTADDYWWLHALTTPRPRLWKQRELETLAISARQADRSLAAIVDAVSSGEPRTRDDLRARLDQLGIATAGQIMYHLLVAAGLDGEIVQGPLVDGEQAFVSTTAWLGPRPPTIDRDEALARLARRYLDGHAPASDNDLATWAGITLGEARRALAGIGDETATCGSDGVGGDRYVLRSRGEPPGTVPPPRLLGPFDPILHGWKDRTPITGAHRAIVTTNGLFRPIALVDGRAVATWGLAAGIVTLRPLEPLSPATTTSLSVDASAVLRYLDLPETEMVIGASVSQ